MGDLPDLFATWMGAPRSSRTVTSEPKPLLEATCRGVLLSLSPRPTSDPFLRDGGEAARQRQRGKRSEL